MHRTVRLLAAAALMTFMPPAVLAQVLTYQDDIRPDLQTSCFSCHSAGNKQGNYAVDSFQEIVKGGSDSVPNVVPGVDADSLIVTRLAADLATVSRLHPSPGFPGAVQPPQALIDKLRRWIVFDNVRQFRQTLFTDRTPVTTVPAPNIAGLIGPAPTGKNCASCHGPAGSFQANYDTSTYDTLFGNGLDSVPNVLPGIRESRLVARLQQDIDANPTDPRHNGITIDAALVDRIRDWIVNDRARFFRVQNYNSDIAILLSTPPGGTACNGACHISGDASAGRYDLTLYNNLFGNGSDGTPNVIPGDRNSRLITRLKEDLAANRKHPNDSFAGAVTLTADYVNRIASWVSDDFARLDQDSPPSANAGSDIPNGRVGIFSAFTGSGADPDPRDLLFFNWVLDRRPAASTTRFINPGRTSFSFKPDADGLYQFTLAVTDGTDQRLDSVQLTVAPNRGPIANAGGDQSTLAGNIVTLDARGSLDPDGDSLTYSWVFNSIPVGSNINNTSLQSRTTANPSFTPDVPGRFILTLSVSDSQLTSSDIVEVVARGTNNPPVANAGPPRRTRRQTSIGVDGRASRDPDGDPITYAWTFLAVPAGSSIGVTSLSPAANVPTPTFIPDLGGNYTMQLVVSDGSLNSSPATVTVTAAVNRVPVAVAEGNPNRDFFLNGKGRRSDPIRLGGGKSTDADQDALTYSWTLRGRPPGSSADETDFSANNSSAAISPTFTPDIAGVYSFGLVVNDGLDSSATAFASVEVSDNFLPIANAGGDRGGVTNNQVSLDGSKSRDFEGSALLYTWSSLSKPADSVNIPTQSGVTPTFSFTPNKPGDYRIRLVVNDSSDVTNTARDSLPHDIVIKVHDAANTQPTAAAGTNQTVALGATVTLNGAGTDPNNDPVSYRWTLVQVPPGSTLSAESLSPTSTIAKPTFRPDIAGDFRWRLTVSDGMADSVNPAEVTITVTNGAPTARAGGPQANFTLFLTPPPQVVILDGTASTDPENQQLTYTWSFISRPSGSNAVITPNGTPQAGIANFTPDRKGLYTVSLVVRDDVQNSSPSSTTINVGNSPPVAAATSPITTKIGNNVVLRATGADADPGDTLTYRWTVVGVPPGSSINDTRLTTNNTTASHTTGYTPDLAGIYLFRVQVNDGTVNSGPVFVRVTVVNTPPRASAAVLTPPPIRAFDQVLLDGSGSRDDETTDINRLNFNWFFVKVPQSSAVTNANISGRTTVSPRFSPDRKGLYTVGLIVSDGFLSSTTATADINVVNTVPTAAAGPDQNVVFGATVQLDGRGSLDNNVEDVLLYTWTIVSNPPSDPVTVGRFSPNGTTLSARPFFTPRAAGTYVIGLTVNDGIDTSPRDTMTLTVTNNAPSANAGPDTTAPVKNPFRLNGLLSSDPDGNPLVYSWRFASIPPVAGSTLTNASIVPNDSTTAARPFFTPDVSGIYRVRLNVNDGLVTAGPDEVVITVTNSAPVANAGPDQLSARQGVPIRLGAGASTDAETPGSLTYSWAFNTLPPGSAVTTSDLSPSASACSPTFLADRRGDYILQVSVSDGLLSSTDNVTIRVINSAPIASAGADITTGAGVRTLLDGTASRDVDREDTITYQWSLVSKPTASQLTTAALSINNTVDAGRPSFVPDRPGNFVWGLVAVDNAVPPASSTRDDVVVTVVNTPPIAVPAANPPSLTVPGTVQLDGSASRDNETPGSLTYVWSFLRVPPGSSVDNSSFVTTRTLVNPRFSPDRKGQYQVELRVNDGLLEGTPAAISVDVINTTPTANAGSDITTFVGRSIRLAGQGFDTNPEDRLVFQWRFASVPPVAGSTLTTAAFSPNNTTSAAITTFRPDRDGTYRVRLTVSDGEALSPADEAVVTVTNSAPTASLARTSATTRNPIVLNGLDSTDQETPNELTYRWEFLSVPPVAGSTLTNAAISPNNSRAAGLAGFVADKKGSYGVKLTVNDGLLDSPPVTKTIVVINSNPVANAGPDFSSSIKFEVSLDGRRSFDANPDDRAGLSYKWTVVGPAGSTVTNASFARNNSNAAATTSFRPDLEGDYRVTLQLTDPDGADSNVDEVVVTVANLPPVARAGADQLGRTVLNAVQMDGSASSDVEGFTITYRWSFESLPAGKNSTLTASAFQPNNTASAARPSWRADRKGVYVVKLVVNDGQRDSTPDLVNVEVVNTAPRSNAGADITTRIGQSVTLDGSRSFDPNFEDNATLVYGWTVVSVPTGSAVNSDSLAPNNAAGARRPSFRPDRSGIYTLSLTVRDAEGAASDADQVVVRVDNLAPVAAARGPETTTAASPIQLDGRLSRDPEGQPLAYTWAFLAVPSGSALGSSSFLPSATSPTPRYQPDRKGAYRVRLTVSDGGLTATTQVQTTVTNSPPVANAGGTRVSSIARPVVLQGSATDPDGEDNLVYKWTLRTAPAGSTVQTGSLSINNSTGAARPSFLPDREGDYTWRLVVNDGTVDSQPSDTVITVRNTTPTAVGGAEQTVSAGALVTLDGTASRDDETGGGELIYTWSFASVPAGSQVNAQSFVPNGVKGAVGGARPVFRPDRRGVFNIALNVSDGTTAGTTSARVIVANSVPVAIAGPNKAAAPGNEVTLDGSGSTDANVEDRAGLIYRWVLETKPPLSTLGTGALQPNNAQGAARPKLTPDVEGTYFISLTVTDAVGATSPASSVRVIAATGNIPPVAEPRAPATTAPMPLGAPVTLDGTASSDLDGSASNLTYSWTIVSKPLHSRASIAFSSSARPSFVPDIDGEYVIALTVSDGTKTDTALVSVQAKATSQVVPVADAGADQVADVASLVVLDGSNSFDANNDPLLYSWARINGPAATLSDPTAAKPSFRPAAAGTYTFQLTVSDGRATSPADIVNVVVRGTTSGGNTGGGTGGGTSGGSLFVSAGGTMSAQVDSSVVLRGTIGGTLKGTASILWTYIGGPVGTVAIKDASSLVASFTPTKTGNYNFKLTVNDGVNTAEDVVRVTVLGRGGANDLVEGGGGGGCAMGGRTAASLADLVVMVVPIVLLRRRTQRAPRSAGPF